MYPLLSNILRLSCYSFMRPCRLKFFHRKLSITPGTFKKATVNVVFIHRDGRKTKAVGKEGDSLLDVVIGNNLDIDGFGACEGTLACSTCHLILTEEDFKKLHEEATDEELDMLDLAFDLSPTSRLGCQCYINKDLDGMEVTIPSQVYDARG